MKPKRIAPELLLIQRENKYTLTDLCEAFGALVAEMELDGPVEGFIFEEMGRIVAEGGERRG
jgi:hypothetical protein